ncbi:hypothetical protein ACGFWI_33970 [Streptomyces sp. NPDC048434]|uniref:hypothetical protein n=1 Tax=Streptomyces sp. NPDC048434 TaxID=3365549 RepID=UPI003710870A
MTWNSTTTAVFTTSSVESHHRGAVMMSDARGHADTWGTIARTYIRLTDDRSLPVAMQDRLVAEADALTPDNPFDVHTLATSHVGYFPPPNAPGPCGNRH